MLDGTYPDVHAFLAIVLFQAGCATDAPPSCSDSTRSTRRR